MATTTLTTTDGLRADQLVTDAVVDRCRQRAATYDRENRFFDEDLDDLRAAGYLQAALPREFGGAGAGLDTIVAAQRRLAAAAPPTALALSMHLYFTGGMAALHAAGDPSFDWLLDAASRGDLIGSGHAETGNDLTVLLSTSRAERVDGGYRITGRKRFGSLGPVWSWLGINALDASDPEHPRVVHAFVGRDDEGVHVQHEWNTLGMRATQSYDTILDSVFVPDDRVARSLPAGDPTDPFFAAMTGWAFLQFAAIYLGIADRALELAIAAATSKTSIAIPRSTLAHHPNVQADIAQMYVDLTSADALLRCVAADVARGVEGVDMPARVIAARLVAVDRAMAVVDRAMDVVGGAAIADTAELSRLYRDVTCGRYNGMTRYVSTELIGKALLGVAPQPRW